MGKKEGEMWEKKRIRRRNKKGREEGGNEAEKEGKERR